MLSHSLRRCLRDVGALNKYIRKINYMVPGRTGALAMKAGMISEFDNNGHRNEITVLALENCQVVQVNHQKSIRLVYICPQVRKRGCMKIRLKLAESSLRPQNFLNICTVPPRSGRYHCNP